MIRSYAADATEQMYLSNWAIRGANADYDVLESCFFDLRLLDAAATTGDLEQLFGDRLVRTKDGDSSMKIGPEAGCQFQYHLTFVWNGSDADKVLVTLGN